MGFTSVIFYIGFIVKDVQRFHVPDEKVEWAVDWPEYQPVKYTAAVVLGPPVLDWADPLIGAGFKPKFNKKDGGINRKSHDGPYKLVDGMPQNPKGRTGISDRGLLGKWGPNHAADPIVTRWKLDENNKKIYENGKPVLQFVAIKRKDGEKKWAIPGGMVDKGEQVSDAVSREFREEALVGLNWWQRQRVKIFFKFGGKKIYTGYVDDPRNTDNAWMETVAYNFHDSKGNSVAKVPLKAGSDASDAMWMDIGDSMDLYASHKDWLKIVAENHRAHW